jgi:hypothetical protein
MTIFIKESGAIFGPFEENSIFHIELSKAVGKLGSNIKKVEFVACLSKNGGESKVLFLEAKQSIPRERNEFFDKIRDKMLSSLILWTLAVVGRHPEINNELPDKLQSIDALLKQIDMVLVIPNLPDEHLNVATEKLREIMRTDTKKWNIKSENIWVLNRSRSIKYGIISS